MLEIRIEITAFTICLYFVFKLIQDFFKALGRVKQIHDDVKILLRTNQQRAG